MLAKVTTVTLVLTFTLVLSGCPLDTPPAPTAAETLAAELGTGAAVDPAVATKVVLSGNVTLDKAVTVPAGVTLVVPAERTLTVPGGKTLTVAATGTLAYEGTVDLAATAILYVNGTLSPSGAGAITEAAGAKIVYSSTANAGSTNAYIGGVGATGTTWSVGAGASFTEIAGTSDTRRERKHEISGGTVTLNKTLTYNKGETDASELTVKTGGALVVGNGTEATPLVELRIRGSTAGKLTVEPNATLTIKAHADLVLGDTGTVTVNGTLVVDTDGKVRTWNGDTGAPITFGASGVCTASIFYPSSGTTAAAAAVSTTYKWSATAGGGAIAGWKAQAQE
jgi:hypothetical protein